MHINAEKENTSYQIKFTVDVEGEIVGSGFLVVIQNIAHVEPYGLVEYVYIDQDHRGKGYGTKLVNAIIEKAKEIGCYKLLAQSRYGKDKVHALYERFGFKDHGKNFRMDLLESESSMK